MDTNLNERRDDRSYAMTLSEAAEFAHVSRPTMAEMLKLDDFPAFKMGRRWIIPRNDFAAWLSKQAAARKGIR